MVRGIPAGRRLRALDRYLGTASRAESGSGFPTDGHGAIGVTVTGQDQRLGAGNRTGYGSVFRFGDEAGGVPRYAFRSSSLPRPCAVNHGTHRSTGCSRPWARRPPIRRSNMRLGSARGASAAATPWTHSSGRTHHVVISALRPRRAAVEYCDSYARGSRGWSWRASWSPLPRRRSVRSWFAPSVPPRRSLAGGGRLRRVGGPDHRGNRLDAASTGRGRGNAGRPGRLGRRGLPGSAGGRRTGALARDGRCGIDGRAARDGGTRPGAHPVPPHGDRDAARPRSLSLHDRAFSGSL